MTLLFGFASKSLIIYNPFKIVSAGDHESWNTGKQICPWSEEKFIWYTLVINLNLGGLKG